MVASGLPIELRGSGFAPSVRITLELRTQRGYRRRASKRATASGRVRFRYRPRKLLKRYRFRYGAGTSHRTLSVRARPVTLAAVGDINLGDGPADAMARNGLRYPWTSVAPVLRRADIAFGNLECAVSSRGSPEPKQYTFRGSRRALRVVARYAGMDVLNLANNHAVDFGRTALLDTLRNVRGFGMTPVGAGSSSRSAGKPRVVRRLGLTVAFVGFSDIGPLSFGAGPGLPGTQLASPSTVRLSVEAARRRGRIVIATFHWGVERTSSPTARQRELARAAFAAGADVVLGGHPHVLQPIARLSGRRLVAWSLGNFVFSASSPGTQRTGILKLKLSARGVERVGFRRAVINDSRPQLSR